MNKGSQAYKKLLFKQEVLLSRLFIRDFFIKHAISEVYENVGQSLSVVRMQLATFNLKSKKDAVVDIHLAGNLVQQSIRDLRVICKSFYPDEDILKEQEFIEAFTSIIAILFQNADSEITTKGEKKEIQHELKLIVFKMLLQILVAVKEAEGKFISLLILYKKNEVKYIICYKGNAVELSEEAEGNDTDAGLTIQQKTQLINAKYKITQSKAGINRIELMSPLKCVFL